MSDVAYDFYQKIWMTMLGKWKLAGLVGSGVVLLSSVFLKSSSTLTTNTLTVLPAGVRHCLSITPDLLQEQHSHHPEDSVLLLSELP